MSMILTSRSRFRPDRLSALRVWFDGSDPNNGALPTTGSTLAAVTNKGWAASAVTCTQSTSAQRPTFQANQYNGKGIIRGTAGSPGTNFTCAGYTFTATSTIFLVATPTSGSNTYIFGSSDSSGTPGIISKFNNGSGVQNYEWYNDNGTSLDRKTFSTAATGLNVCEVVQTDGSSLITAFNGTQTFSGAPTVNLSGFVFNILLAVAGLSTTFVGDFGGILIFNSALSTSDRSSVRHYLGDWFGISVT